MLSDSNPFSTRFVRPGQTPMLGVQPGVIENLARRWQHADSIGQIVGPHGSGKTTLTFALESMVNDGDQAKADRGYCFRRLTIRGKKIWPEINLLTHGGVHPHYGRPVGIALVVDGIEALSPLNRMALVGYCRDRKIGLLLTTHRRLLGVKVLQRMSPSVRQLREIVDTLTLGTNQPAIGDAVLEQAFRSANGNLREWLMTLYDWWELNGRQAIEPTAENTAGHKA